jgi:hypothetical protein
LEASSSQYFSKTSPAGITFTTTFTCSAWVKLESYGSLSGIIARRNGATEGWSMAIRADGTVQILGLRIASNNKSLISYQSIPLNKWVHIAACIDMTAGDTTAQKIWIDGVEVPRVYTLTGTATAIVQGTTALVIGAETSSGSNPFDGKIAQASVHSACLSDAQIKAMMSQTIDSSSPSIVSGFTLNNTLEDVTANNNDLTASGSAVATNVDSPFGSYLGGTLDYGIITKTAFSTNTTLTVQVPEGCTIPTSGGVSAVAYSTQSVPYLFPRDSGRWEVVSLLKTQVATTSNATFGSFNGGGWSLTVPTGGWTLGYSMPLFSNVTTNVTFALSPTSITGLARGAEDTTYSVSVQSSAAAFYFWTANVYASQTLSAPTTYLVYTVGATTGAGLDGDNGLAVIKAIPAYL